MLGGIAQAQVNDQLRDLDEKPKNQQSQIPKSWTQSFPPNSYQTSGLLGSYTNNVPMYQVKNNKNNNNNQFAESSNDFADSYLPQRHKKNTKQQKPKTQNNNMQYPLVNSLTNFKMPKPSNQVTKLKSSFGNFNDFSSKANIDDGWGESMPKKEKTIPMKPITFYNPKTGNYLRPVGMKNKNAPDRKFKSLPAVKTAKTPATELRPPPIKKIL
jgi:hypothetical protein